MNGMGIRRIGAKWVALGLLVGLVAWLPGCDGDEDGKQAGGAPPTTAAKWKMASAFPSDQPMLGDGEKVASAITRLSQGQITVEYQIPGTDAAPLDTFEAVSQAKLHAAWGSAAFWTHRIPAAEFFSAIPFGPDTPELLAWVYEGGGLKLWRELYAPFNVRPIPCGVLPPRASGWFRDPVSRVEQFQGLKLRLTGMGGKILQKLGATVVPLAGKDIEPAMREGLIDGTEFYLPSIDEKAGFFKFVKNYQFPGWQRQSSLLELLVNETAWKALSPTGQELLESVCRANVLESMAKGEATQHRALESFRKLGVQVHYWPDPVLQALKGAYNDIIELESAKDPDFKKVHDAYQAFRDRYREWGEISRLPKAYQP